MPDLEGRLSAQPHRSYEAMRLNRPDGPELLGPKQLFRSFMMIGGQWAKKALSEPSILQSDRDLAE